MSIDRFGPPAPDVLRRWTTAGLAVPALLAALYYCWRIQIPLEVGYNEPWNAWHALRWAAGGPLYPDPNDLVFVNYPPLSFVLIGGLVRLGADPVITGRILSLVAVPIVAVAAASVVRSLGGGRAAATLAATWWTAALLVGFSTYVGMNDPSLPAMVPMSIGFALFVRAEHRSGSLLPGLAVMLLAGFFKHNVVALPVGALLWVWSTRPRRAVVPTLLAAAAAAAGLAVCVHLYGWAFVEQMTMPRQMSLARAFTSLETPPWPAVAFAVVVCGFCARRGGDRPWAILLVTAIVTFLLQRSGDGVSNNAQLELVFAAAVGFGLASDRVVERTFDRRGALLVALGFAAIFAKEAWSFASGPFLLPLSPAFRADIDRRSAAFEREVARVAALPGTIACDRMSICLRAGRPFVYDPFGVHCHLVTGRWSEAEVAAAVARRGIVFVTTDPEAVWPSRRGVWPWDAFRPSGGHEPTEKAPGVPAGSAFPLVLPPASRL